ncbi:MAG: hypoxanthine phosphoribosyltransferase [Corynebacterium sp.]|uniref:Hypoxanthine phosphoribosyltransferase n=1 Tax=Candidatus Corynebacterium faecigallinarum TaxID=2838528 RepID=A0A9D2TR08_9CORY|nr:hypoxanthine phosphoribosyltransferase [Corynebacterium sp.]HJC85574.1 hypoxanthine phosphoribosyltransferase [Candidatus Corynebacterium faecigallinarum]MDN5723768.1 hypoxanthine phosphoribosyltransferase [Corynebacterium sp.]MDN6283331.1 hypoxanthine phosphoribosyltransferase [Corynebacterium sp.]MDN6304368.1 hypoxanthine phosphoribosyltransferase [Corynebacterium sp.]MDN6351891.1 hypoxanthine phosphoribosyltransferase [Corynebacterium sp.]
MISKKTDVPDNCYGDDVEAVLVDHETLHARIAEMARAASDRYRDEDEDTILVCVLKGATYFIADFARAMDIPTQMEFMVVSSYGSSAHSSGTVEIIMDLKRDIRGRNVIILEDIIESGITLSWLVSDLAARGPKNLEVITLLRKPEAVQKQVDASEVGFEIPNDFVVGYGLDYAERYRDLPWVGTLRPSVYS